MAARIRTTTEQGPTVVVGETTVLARSQVITLDFPFAHLVWHRPTDILVERGGRPSRHKLVDVTRALQVGFYGLAAAFFLVSVVAGRPRGSRRSA